MSEKHPDIFTPEEAAEYLRLPSVESLRNLRDKGMLTGYQITTHLLYWREDLNRCAMRMCGRNPDSGKPASKELKLAGGR